MCQLSIYTSTDSALCAQSCCTIVETRTTDLAISTMHANVPALVSRSPISSHIADWQCLHSPASDGDSWIDDAIHYAGCRAGQAAVQRELCCPRCCTCRRKNVKSYVMLPIRRSGGSGPLECIYGAQLDIAHASFSLRTSVKGLPSVHCCRRRHWETGRLTCYDSWHCSCHCCLSGASSRCSLWGSTWRGVWCSTRRNLGCHSNC